MKFAAIAILITILLCTPLSAGPGQGAVCVAPNSPDPPQRFSAGGEYNPKTLTFKFDQRPPVAWPHKDSLKVEGLDLTGRHLIVLTSDGKRIQSFWFRFADYQSLNLCIAFDGYQGVQLKEMKNSPWCKCK
jgi:hypothetical protein